MKRYLPRYPLYLLAWVIIAAMMTCISILCAEAMGTLTDYLAGHGLAGSGRLAADAVSLYGASAAAEALFLILCGLAGGYAFTAMSRSSLHAIMTIPVDHILLRQKGDLINRASADTEEVLTVLKETLPGVIVKSVRLILVIAFLFWIAPAVTGIYLAAVCASVLLQILISRITRTAVEAAKEQEVALNTDLADVVGNRLLVKTGNAVDFAMEGVNADGEALVSARIRQACVTMPLRASGIALGMIPIFSVCLAGFHMIARGMLPVSTFLTAYYLCQSVVSEQLHYVDDVVALSKSWPAMTRLKGLWKDGSLELQEPSAGERTGKEDAICLAHVTYSYPGESHPAIEDLSLSIKKGSCVAFAGESGCGKSTALQLIAGLLAPQKGSVAAAPAVLTKQTPFIFTGSIRENLTWGRGGEAVPETEIRKVCEEVSLRDYLDMLPDGLETILSSDAGTMSGGQKQRLAVARALLSGADVLLFDESLSALDAVTAEQVLKCILEERDGRTIVMVIHQREFLPLFDEVYTFEDGRLTGRGEA